MFIPVKQADCTVELKKYNEFIERILSFSIQSLVKELDINELRDYIEPEMRVLLNRKKIFCAIQELFQLTYVERLDTYNAFVNDIDFPKYINDERYHLTELSQDVCSVLDNAVESALGRM